MQDDQSTPQPQLLTLDDYCDAAGIALALRHVLHRFIQDQAPRSYAAWETAHQQALKPAEQALTSPAPQAPTRRRR